MDNIYKVTFIGASTTGKTTLVIRLVRKYFFNITECTIGASFTKYKHNNMEYDFWDTAGQERFNSLLPMYFRGTKIFIFVFDLSEENTISNFNKYYRDLSLLPDQNYKIIIVGNKSDLVSNDTIKYIDSKIKTQLGDSCIGDKIFDYMYVSAKTGNNCDDISEKLHLCAQTIGYPEKTASVLDGPIKLGDNNKNMCCY
jgi:Ras-related protein Rab-5C